jgi:hypothetical protein
MREKIRRTPSTIWSEGPLSNLDLTVMDSPHVVFQFCSDVVEILNPQTAGIQAFYATDAQTIQQINWVRGSNEWTTHEQFTANGHAGMACYTWGPGSVQYKMFVNLDNEVNLMWRDLNTTIAPNATHPINSWTNTTISIPGVLPTTNLAYNDYLVMQMQDGSLAGYNITFNAENTNLVPDGQVQLEGKALDGTHLWLWEIPTQSGDKQLTVFNQQNGSDITLTLRDLVTGQSLSKALPVPDA